MKKILIIDDEKDLCSMLKTFLVKSGYEVHSAHTLIDGVEKLRTGQPAVLLLDNNLPDGVGYNYVANIHKKYPTMKIILISAYGVSDEAFGMLNPETQVMAKPLDLLELEEAIKN